MTVPNQFANVTTTIPLSQLDANFNTPITLGNTAIQLGNTVTTLNNMTFANVTITSVSTPITAAQGGTGLSTLASNNVLLGNGTGTVQVVAPGSAGNVLTSTGTTWTSNAASSLAVTSFSAGTTGFTPNSATQGAVTLAGTLATTNGGTGLTSFTANGVLYASSTSALTTGSAFTFDGSSAVISVNSATDALRITQVGAGNALVVEDSANPDSTPFVVDSIGRVLAGTPTALNVSGEAGFEQLQITSTTSLSRWTAASSGPNFTFAKSRSGTIGTNTIVQDSDSLGVLAFNGADGTSFISGARIQALVDGTPGTNDMPGRLVFSTTADGASSPTERMRINNAGQIGFNSTLLGGGSGQYRFAGNITGSTSSVGILYTPTIQSDVTTVATIVSTQPSTQDAAFTLTDLVHFRPIQGTISGGSRTAPTNQYGFQVTSGLTGATNNYGFYSNIASGTGRWNFYANGTADNYFAGNVGIGTSAANTVLRINKNVTGSTFSNIVYATGQIQSDVTGAASYFFAQSSQAAGFTCPDIRLFQAVQGTYSGTVTSQFGFLADSTLTGATNNYGFYSNIASGTGRWNFYANGTADNYFAGNVGLGVTPSARRLGVSGNLTGGTTAYGVLTNPTVQSDVTATAYYYRSTASTAAAAFTLTDLIHYAAIQSTIGATSAVTNQYGFFVQSNVTGATNNFGFYSDIASGSGRWNFYANGTAANYFAGDMQLDKTVTAAGTTGAQTINKNAGTVNFAAAATSLVVTNNRVTANSIIICTVGTNDTTMKSVSAVAGAGSFTLHANAAATAETRVNFLIIN